jgi:hypothetical protein
MYGVIRLRTVLEAPKSADPFTRLRLLRHVLVWLL